MGLGYGSTGLPLQSKGGLPRDDAAHGEDSPNLAPAAVVALSVLAVGTDTAEGNLVLDLDDAAAPRVVDVD
jgi:hypothetical protein